MYENFSLLHSVTPTLGTKLSAADQVFSGFLIIYFYQYQQ